MRLLDHTYGSIDFFEDPTELVEEPYQEKRIPDNGNGNLYPKSDFPIKDHFQYYE
jgi:hypothetical protein